MENFVKYLELQIKISALVTHKLPNNYHNYQNVHQYQIQSN